MERLVKCIKDYEYKQELEGCITNEKIYISRNYKAGKIYKILSYHHDNNNLESFFLVENEKTGEGIWICYSEPYKKYFKLFTIAEIRKIKLEKIWKEYHCA